MRGCRWGLADVDIARHVIDTHFEHLFLDFKGFYEYDEALNMCQALRHPTHFEPSFLELDGII